MAARRISAAEAAALVRSGDWVEYGGALGQPDVFDAALAERVEELRDVKLRGCLTLRPRAVVEVDPGRDHFHWFSWHFTAYDRAMGDRGLASYIPCNLGEIPDYYRRVIEQPEIAVIKTCPRDERGFFNFSLAALWHGAIVERAKLVIVEESAGLPYVEGLENAVHESDVDYIIEGDHGPAPEVPNPLPTDVDRVIARLIAGEIEDGSCLQIGIGAMPNAVCSLLLESGVRNLGVHTEMLTDGIVDLYRAGIVTGARKTLYPGKVVCTFGFGTERQYETADRNPDFVCLAVDLINPPEIVMQNERVVSINNTTQMDLQGQAASESAGHRHISGTGGQSQFVRGAYASSGGKSFICMSSEFVRHGVRASRIVLDLTPGNIVTTTRADVMYVVTEYGIVNLKGTSIPERARAMISIAHPDFREDLERDAREHGLIPKDVF
ncbi:MAG: acetyl-CoA hydrolase/transferase C-terminal domain-containing protein [Solirubrobacteraceae bacterium]|jgi:acyl-CoA hydrolase